MEEKPGEQESAGGGETGHGFWILFTPESQIRRRANPKDIVSFILGADQVLNSIFDDVIEMGAEFQVGCVLLPGNEIIVEVLLPPAITDRKSKLAAVAALREMDVPDVFYAPIILARRWTLTPGWQPTERYGAFGGYSTRADPTHLDRFLMEAADLPRVPAENQESFGATVGDVLAFVMPRVKVASQLRELGNSVIARTSPVTIANPQLGEYQKIEPSGSGKFTKLDFPGGGAHFVDDMKLKYLQSTAPQPTQVSLDRLLAGVCSARIIAGGIVDDAPEGTDELLQITDGAMLQELGEKLRIIDGPAGHCMCTGDPTIELLGEDGARLGLIGLHHSRTIRSIYWKDDAELIDGGSLAQWLADRGIKTLLDETDRRTEFDSGSYRE